mmetsp:Transcript_34902/g.64198  ORF Transcript_34902/g.64198 Transcript_34902/m.64198 type:complete len:82 (-) Transcript_34902:223-468(-)
MFGICTDSHNLTESHQMELQTKGWQVPSRWLDTMIFMQRASQEGLFESRCWISELNWSELSGLIVTFEVSSGSNAIFINAQ